MKRTEKEKLEELDLILLHAGDGGEEADMADLQISCPEDFNGGDIWSRALAVLSGEKKDTEDIRKIYSEMMACPLPAEVLRWWEVLFALALQAPPAELLRMAAGCREVPDRAGIAGIDAAAVRIAQRAWEREEEARRRKAQEEQKRLRELQRRAEAADEARTKAERDLEAHRKSGGTDK